MGIDRCTQTVIIRKHAISRAPHRRPNSRFLGLPALTLERREAVCGTCFRLGDTWCRIEGSAVAALRRWLRSLSPAGWAEDILQYHPLSERHSSITRETECWCSIPSSRISSNISRASAKRRRFLRSTFPEQGSSHVYGVRTIGSTESYGEGMPRLVGRCEDTSAPPAPSTLHASAVDPSKLRRMHDSWTLITPTTGKCCSLRTQLVARAASVGNKC